MSELETIFSEGREVKIGQRVVVIKTIELGQIPVLVDIATKIYSTMGANKDQKAAITKLVKEDFESFLQLFVVTTNLDMTEIKKLNIAAATEIFSNVVKDNADFFTQNVLPLASALKETLTGLNKSKN